MAIHGALASVRAEMARAGVTQKDVAEWLSIAESQVSQRVNGHIDWRLSEIRIIAERLGVPLATLVDEPAAQESAS